MICFILKKYFFINCDVEFNYLKRITNSFYIVFLLKKYFIEFFINFQLIKTKQIVSSYRFCLILDK